MQANDATRGRGRGGGNGRRSSTGGVPTQGSSRSRSASTSEPRSRGQNFNGEEIERLLNIIDDVKPVGQAMWEEVARRYNEATPRERPTRNHESLKARFKRMVHHPKPTGDPDCPEEIRRTKRLHRMVSLGP
ncbi:hypothetical protein HDU76_010931 [Blyttiomyces sp. JEL0837]|nr:hypothetical protein HDU76_010931 [Blyttiomyces sp. JEL0837]